MATGLGVFAIICDKITAKDIVPKWYEEMGCTEVKDGDYRR